MDATNSRPADVPKSASAHIETQRALVVSSIFAETDAAKQIGQQNYSYYFVYRAFAPLLERWASTFPITQPESRLDYALWRARQQKLEPLHLSFLPLHLTYLTSRARTVAFPFWEFPDIPNFNIAHNPRNNWVRVAERVALILTASNSTRDAFVRAGVKTPVHVVPVPIRPEYFEIPAWEPGQRLVLDFPGHVVTGAEPHSWAGFENRPTSPARDPWAPIGGRSLRGMIERVRRTYKGYIRPRLPRLLDLCLVQSKRAATLLRPPRRAEDLYPTTPTLDLSGIVYTAVLNPFDPRKNWRDLLSAFLLALGDCADATLVIKLAVGQKLRTLALDNIMGYYGTLGRRHRCKLVVVSEHLSDAQMTELARASTYHLNAARAEGACLPLQDSLAAGRPGIAPVHTALADYFHDGLGFPVVSHPEPTYWPHDPEKRRTTFWHRLVWQSLHDQIRASYVVARQDRERYREMAACGREQMADHASLESVWPRLAAALDSVEGNGEHPEGRVPAGVPEPLCETS